MKITKKHQKLEKIGDSKLLIYLYTTEKKRESV
jgi:hypothetical protein